MALIAYALPILPGQSGRAGSFEQELTPELRVRYEELNREQSVRRHMEWVQQTPMGDVLIVVFDVDTPERMFRTFADDGYDRWWRDRVLAIHGFDPGAPDFHPVIAPVAFTWTDESTPRT